MAAIYTYVGHALQICSQPSNLSSELKLYHYRYYTISDDF